MNSKRPTLRKQSATLKIIGRVQFYLFPAEEVPTYDAYIKIGEGFAFPGVRYARCKNYGWLKEDELNLVVNAGLNQLILLMNGGSATNFTACGVGSGSTTPAATDTDLTTPITRIAVTNIYQAANVGHWDTFFSASTGNGTWNESGLFSTTTMASGIMLCHKLLASSFAKTSSNTATVAWTITVTAV